MPNIGHATTNYALQALRECLNVTSSILTFAVLREPWQRRISAWKDVVRDSRAEAWRSTPYYRYNLTFSTHIESGNFLRVPPDQGVYGSSFALTQSAYVGPCTILFAMERLDVVLRFLQRFYPLISMPRKNVNEGSWASFTEVTRHAAAQQAMSQRAREILNRIDADDARLWASVMEHNGVLVPDCADTNLIPCVPEVPSKHCLKAVMLEKTSIDHE